jgi:hypothetical protein
VEMNKWIMIVIGLALIAMIGYVIFGETPSQKPITNQKKLENFLAKNRASDSAREAYRFAMENPNGILDQVPCFCGCLESGEHQNNKDCFIDSASDDEIVFDKMGLNCATCTRIAKLAETLQDQGRSSEEIKQQIDTKFKNVDES